MFGPEGEEHLLPGAELFVMVDLETDFVASDPHAAFEEAAEIDGVDHLTLEQIAGGSIRRAQVQFDVLRPQAQD